MQPPGILQGNSVLRGDRAPRCKRHLASHILGCAPLGNWVALTGPILVPKTPCGSSSMQNSRQRIGFWAITGVQPIEYGKEGQVTGCLKFLILGVRLKIRSFGGSFDPGLRFGCRTGPSPLRRDPAFRPRIGRVRLLRRQGLWVCRPCPCVFSARRCFRAACWRMSERPSSFG